MAALDSKLVDILNKIEELEKDKKMIHDSIKSWQSEFQKQAGYEKIKIVDEEIKRKIYLVELLTRK